MPVEAYADDYANPDIKPPDTPDSGAALCLAQLHDMIGLQLESTKHQPPSCVNTFLGVDCDTSHVQDKEPYVEFRPSKGRIAHILDLLAQSAKFGMSSHAAQMLKGKLSFVLQSAWGRVARAATQPLATRSGSHTNKQLLPDDCISWTPALQTMRKFLTVELNKMPPLRWYLGAPTRPTVMVYFDAQYSLVGCKGLGVVVHDKETSLNHICGGEVPPDIVEWVIAHRGNLQSQINQCEFLALVAVVLTFSDLLRDRHVVFWADNTTALAAAVHGYSAYLDLAALSNTLHLLLAGLRTRTYFMHVPGEANIADIPSRVPFVPGAQGQPVLHPAGLKPADKTAIDSILLYIGRC